MGILDKLRGVQAERSEAAQIKQALAVERARAEAAQAEAARAEAERQRMNDILGPDLATFEVTSPEDAKVGIKLARLRKKELQQEKRELAAELADVREE